MSEIGPNGFIACCRINNYSCNRMWMKWLSMAVCFFFSQFLLPAWPAGCSSLWEQLRLWVSCLLCPPPNAADPKTCCSSSICLKSDYIISKYCWVIFGPGALLCSLSLSFSFFLHPSAAARRATHAWKLGGIQTTATPALTASAGPSWLSSDSWRRTSGKTFTCW